MKVTTSHHTAFHQSLPWTPCFQHLCLTQPITPGSLPSYSAQRCSTTTLQKPTSQRSEGSQKSLVPYQCSPSPFSKVRANVRFGHLLDLGDVFFGEEFQYLMVGSCHRVSEMGCQVRMASLSD